MQGSWRRRRLRVLIGTVPNQITDPSNPNRTILKILNEKYQDPIKAKVEYNKTTGLIETRITYSKYGINKITFEDTTELQMTETNGIITANTEGITLASGKNKITIIDNNGTKKNIKVTVPYTYGNKVYGYECATEGVEWRLFHADDNNIYLIADDYIPYENLPTSTNGTKLNTYSAYSAEFSPILNDYTGSSWIKENTNEKAQKWLSKYLAEYPDSTNNNMKAVAYMMDTNKWGENFKGAKAEYAIGGPTLELFCASYKETHPSRYIECDSVTSYGYNVKWSNGLYSDLALISGLIQDDFNSIYIKSNISKANGIYLASPSARSTVTTPELITAISYSDASISCVNIANLATYGFRPVVCLKPDVQLMDNGDNTYSIKEQITAKAEYNKDTNQIEVRIACSEYGISKIVLNNSNELAMVNTNGIITANTGGIGLKGGKDKITVIDNNGNKKEIEVNTPYGKEYYGKAVTNYMCEAQGVDTWRIFYVDDQNIYLIADDYVPYVNLPKTIRGTALRKGSTDYNGYFTNIINDYTGSSWIRTNTNARAQKWLNKYLTVNPNNTDNSIKSVAYMMDTKSWSCFAGSKAEYAIGGPTLELFSASYKVTHPDRYVECNSMTDNGYQVKWSDSSYAYYIDGLTQDDFSSIYIKSDTTKANGMWLASPSDTRTTDVMYAKYSGHVGSYTYSSTNLGFRPVVCLKSGVKLIDNGDGTCSIQ